MAIQFVVHEDGDSVGVVTVEGVKAGQELTGWVMKEDKLLNFKALDDIPIGSSTASISARWWLRSKRASISTFTTSRPKGGSRHGSVQAENYGIPA